MVLSGKESFFAGVLLGYAPAKLVRRIRRERVDPRSRLPSAVSPGEDYWFVVAGIGCPLLLGIADGDELVASEPLRDVRLL